MSHKQECCFFLLFWGGGGGGVKMIVHVPLKKEVNIVL